MKATGIVRRLDQLGRIVLPKDLRRAIGIPADTPMEIFTGDDGEVILQKYQPCCVFCGEGDGVDTFKGKYVCEKCRAELGKTTG